jgi:hypothetical protein
MNIFSVQKLAKIAQGNWVKELSQNLVEGVEMDVRRFW